MEKTVKILHLSDLHIDKEHFRDQKVVLRALFSDVTKTVSKNGPYDLVFFTGDLIAKGKYTEDNKLLATNEFIVPLLAAAQIDPDRLIIIPGNHDVSLSEQSGLIGSAQKSLFSEEDIARYLKEAMGGGPKNGLEGFNEILQKLDASNAVLNNNHYRAYILEISGIKVGIAALNSAWHATGKPGDSDYGQLLVSRLQMDEAIEAIRNCSLKLVLLHHPLGWLSQKDARNTHRQILIHFDGLFHGHNHESDAIVTSGTASSYFTSNAGCLYQHREYFNGYCSIVHRLTSKKWEVSAREYYEPRQAFDKATRFGPEGYAEFIQTRDSDQNLAPPAPSDEYIDSAQVSFNSRLLPSLVSEVAPRSLKSIFVEPLLSRVSQRKLDAGSKNGKSGIFIPIKEVLQPKKPIIFLGTKDMGKTTLLQHVCSLSLEFGTDMPPFGAYIDLAISTETVAGIIEVITSFCGGAYRKSEIIALLNGGNFCICFDNLSEHRPKQLKAVREFCALYPRCRHYFAMLEEIDYSLSDARVPKIIEDSEIIYLHPFGRKETRHLTQNWFGETADECAAKVDEVFSLLARLNIPRSPFLISALLWIRERQTQFSPVNQAEILDALIDGVMEKLSETKDRSKIDSTIKRHYLAALAEHLYSSGTKKIEALELDRFTVHYFESKGLAASTGPFLTELKSKRILLEVGSEVTFMFDAIRAFFLSTRLHENPALLDKALSREHFLQLGEELDYYTGRHRDQSEVLRRVVELVTEFCADTKISHDLIEFDKIRIGHPAVAGAVAQKIAKAARIRARPTVEERHEILDSFDGGARTHGNEEVLQRSKDRNGIASYLNAITIGSTILRNSELVGDLALKQCAYFELTNRWCQILIEVMEVLDSNTSDIVGDSAVDPIIQMLQGMLPTDNPGMAKYLTRLFVPNVIISFALESIGTSKLQLIMERHYAQPLTTIQHLLDVFLMVDLRLPKWQTHLEGLLTKYRKNKFVCELIFSKLFQIFMLGRLRPNEEERIRALLGEAITLMTSEKREKAKTRMKGNFLRGLEKRRLIAR